MSLHLLLGEGEGTEGWGPSAQTGRSSAVRFDGTCRNCIVCPGNVRSRKCNVNEATK